jgi:hypothetical protein
MQASLLLSIALTTSVFQENSLEAVLRSHQLGLDLLHTFTAELETSITPDGQSWKPAATVRWVKSGDRERFSVKKYSSRMLDGKPRDRVDWIDQSYAPDEIRALLGWNRENPPLLPLSPKDGFSGVLASITPSGSSSNLLGPAQWLLFTANDKDSLAGLASPRNAARLNGKKKIDGSSMWEVELKDPTTKGQLVLHIDPDRNYLMRERITHLPPSTKSPSGVTTTRPARCGY